MERFGIIPNFSNSKHRQAKFETQPRSLFTLTPTSGVSCWLWKINPYFKLTSYPPQMSSWYVKLNLKHIPHAWIIKHFNWTQFHNPKIKVFYIPRIIHHLFGQVDRKRTQFTVPNWMDFLGRRSNLDEEEELDARLQPTQTLQTQHVCEASLTLRIRDFKFACFSRSIG